MGFVRLSVRCAVELNDESGDQAMVFNIDGDYINRGNFINAAMFDLERVEVLRGPQGTLYGRNATAGAVNVIARKPSLDGLDAIVSADLGDYSSQIYNGAINFTLGSKVAIRLAAMSAEHDGYTEHPNFDEATNSQDSEAYRFGILFQLTDAWSIYLAAEHAEDFGSLIRRCERKHPPYTADAPVPGTCSSPGWDTVGTFAPGFACAPHGTNYVDTIDREDYVNYGPWLGERNQDTTGYRGSVEYGGEGLSAIYRFAFRESHWDGAQALPGLMFYREEDDDTTSHELRFSGTADNGFFWQAGLFYFKDEVDGKGGLHLPFGGQADPTGFGIYLNTFYRPVESNRRPCSPDRSAVRGHVQSSHRSRYTQDEKGGTFYSLPARLPLALAVWISSVRKKMPTS